MKHVIKAFILFAAISIFFVSCKKDEEEYVTSYSDGKVLYERINDTQAVVKKSTGTSSNITIPDSVPMGRAKVAVISINEQAFEGDSKIQTINYGKLINKIGNRAFAQSTLQSITIKSTVSSIGIGVCENCLKLESVTIEKGLLTEIPENAFSVDWVANTQSSALKSLKIGEGIKTIGKMAFWRTNAQIIDIPNSVERIEQSAFFQTGAELITIGTGIKYIGDTAFDRAAAKSIIIKAKSVPEIGFEAFSMFYNPIYVEDSLIDTWKKVLPPYSVLKPISSL